MTMLTVRLDGPAGAAPLILGPSLGTTVRLWDELLPALARDHRVLRFDLPGHGACAATTVPADPDVAWLGGLVLAAADEYGLGRFAYAGVSLGGAIGAWLALRHPDRVTSLALVCSSARFGELAGWVERAATVRAHGMAPIVDVAPGRWFTPAFAEARPDRLKGIIADLAAVDPAGYAACCAALAGYDLRAELPAISAPTLVVAGRDDPATPPRHSRELADGIPGATLLEVAGAAHLAGVERPDAVGPALLAHLRAARPHRGPEEPGEPGEWEARPRYRDDAERHAAGMAVRRAVLGDPHVDAAQAATTPVTADFQDLITRYAWGEIWTRPGLDRRARSIITLTALVAGGHENELAMHLRAARRNGLTDAEITEVLLQTAIYCGVPAANSAFAVARQVLAEPGAS